MMNLGTPDLEVESEQIYLVYDGTTGAIAHVHRVVTHRGATPKSGKQGDAASLEMASRFGHRQKNLRVLRAETFDSSMPQRVDTKTLKILAIKPVEARRPAKASAPKGK